MTLKRDYSIDNIKGIMIFLVVLAHLFEFNVVSKISFLLIIIYSFHMPVFVFYSGRLAKYNPSKMITNIVIPYLIIQILSYLFYKMMGLDIVFRIVTAYTTLWYMISLFFWYMAIPFLEKVKKPIIAILLSVILGLIIGYDKTAYDCLSVSRTLVFFPFFVLGYYSNKINLFEKIKKIKYPKILISLLVCVVIFVLYYFRGIIHMEWFYQYGTYTAFGYNPMIRFLIYIAAFIWIIFFQLFIPNKKCNISKIGKNSLSVYLLHYMIVYFIAEKTNLLYIGSHPILNCLIIAIIITFVLSRDFVNNVFKGKIGKFTLSKK